MADQNAWVKITEFEIHGDQPKLDCYIIFISKTKFLNDVYNSF